jgi:preprotein translocase subunit SecY
MNELVRRIAFTIGALLVFRVGSHIPLTGIWTSYGPLPPGAMPRFSIFALVLGPYVTAAVVVRFLCMVWARLNSLERSGEAGRRAIARYTLILTLLLATLQAYGVATGVQRGAPELIGPSDTLFLLSATTSMAAGVFLLIWLCEQITRHGIGNGLALVLSVNILAPLPRDIAAVFEVVSHGMVRGDVVLFHAVFWVVVVAAMVCFEGARRNIKVDFSERRIGGRILPVRSTVLPIKLNSAGFLIPVMAAPLFWSLPLTFAASQFGQRLPWLAVVHEHIGYGKPAHVIIGSIAVFVLAFVYASYVIDPEHAADVLAKQGGTIPGVAPGEATADHLDRVLSLTMLVGAIYLVAVSLIPELLVAYRNIMPLQNNILLPYKIGGGSALIVVCTILDIRKQVRVLSLTNPGGERR